MINNTEIVLLLKLCSSFSRQFVRTIQIWFSLQMTDLWLHYPNVCMCASDIQFAICSLFFFVLLFGVFCFHFNCAKPIGYHNSLSKCERINVFDRKLQSPHAHMRVVENVFNHKFNTVDGTVKSTDFSSVKKELQMQIKLAGDQQTTNHSPFSIRYSLFAIH